MFKVENALVCDIIRQEEAGKFGCLGVYPNRAVWIDDFALPLHLSFLMEITSDQQGDVPVHFLLEDRARNKVFSSFAATIRLDRYETPPLFTKPIEIRAEGPCFINFSAIAGDQKVELIGVAILQATSPIA